MKLNRGENRAIMKMLGLRGVPTIIFMDEGKEFSSRLVGDVGATPENIESAIKLYLSK